MGINGLLIVCLVSWGIKGLAQQSVSKADQPYSLSLTTEFHSTGHLPYSGVYLNNHLNAEINLSWEHRQTGAFISKNIDFIDPRSPVNFSTIGVCHSFQLSKSLKVTPYAGCFLKQTRSWVDKGSDLWAAVMIKVTINAWLFVENTILVGNLVLNPNNVSLANRLNVAASVGKFRLDAFTWYSHSFNSAPHFVSASVAVTSPDWVITPSLSMRLQIAMLQQVANERPENAMHRGALISLIIPLDLSNPNDNKNANNKSN